MKKRYNSVLSLIVGIMLVGTLALAFVACGDAEGGPSGGGGGGGGGETGGGYDESYTLQYVLTKIATVNHGKTNAEFSSFVGGGEKTYKQWADWLGITFDQFIIEIKAAISAEEGYSVTGIKQTNGEAITETTPLWIVGYYVYVTFTN